MGGCRNGRSVLAQPRRQQGDPASRKPGTSKSPGLGSAVFRMNHVVAPVPPPLANLELQVNGKRTVPMVCATVLCAISLAAAAPSAAVETPWFTLMEEPGVTAGNVIQVRPEPLNMDSRVLMQLRVSRNKVRTSFKGHPYRSYDAKVMINCTNQTAWYLWLAYYAQPNWTGPVVTREEYEPGKAPVLFKDIPGEHYKRMITSACKVAT